MIRAGTSDRLIQSKIWVDHTYRNGGSLSPDSWFKTVRIIHPEHEEALKELSDKMSIFKGAKYALGHNPENRTDGQAEKIRLIENDYPDLYRAYQMKEGLRLILHMKGSPKKDGV